MEPPYEVVVAVHSEPLDWLGYLPPDRAYDLKISCSSPGRSMPGMVFYDKLVWRDNVGREAGHWLQHLVDCYHCLAPHTVFLQGDPFPHGGGNLHGPYGLFRILFGKPDFSADWCAVGATPEPSPFPPPPPFPNRMKILRHAWQGEPPLANTPFFLIGAQFVVSRELVRKRPVDHYRRLLDLAHCSDFSLAHELEPHWRHIFA